MASRPRRHLSSRLAGQVAIIIVALGLAAAPPAAGKLLLVPLDGRPAARTLALALDHWLLPLAAGPIPGSLVVRADRDRPIGSLLGAGILPLPAFSGGCVA